MLNTTIRERVDKTLRGLGYTGISIIDHGEGKISLTCVGIERDDVSILRAAALAVAGVYSVTAEIS